VGFEVYGCEDVDVGLLIVSLSGVVDRSPEDGGSVFLRNVGTSPHGVTARKISDEFSFFIRFFFLNLIQ
jgi:hypothetical protein